MNAHTLLFLCFFASAYSADLRCFDCSPDVDGKCLFPGKDNTKVTACTQNAAGDLQFECFSAYFVSDNLRSQPTGVYRGCVEKEKSNTQTFCEYLKDRLPGGNITRCKSCASDQCNTQDVASSDSLRCYDCDPETPGRCINPDTDNVPITVCQGDSFDSRGLKKEISDIDKLNIEPRINDPDDLTFECYSIYYEEDGETGVYRGCLPKNRDVLSSCEYLKESLADGNVVVCESCSEPQCNTHDVGGATSLMVSLGIIVFNLVCVRMLF